MIPVTNTEKNQHCWCYAGGARPRWFYNEQMKQIECRECKGGCSIQTIYRWPDGFEKLAEQLPLFEVKNAH